MNSLLVKYILKFTSTNKSHFFLKISSLENIKQFTTKAGLHFFKSHKTESQLIQEIADNVTFKSDNFIATNKPYGLNCSEKNVPNSKHFSKMSEYYIEDLLPQVATRLGYDSLTLIKAPARDSSGVMFLSTTNVGVDEVLAGISHSKRTNLYNFTYLAVTEHPLVLKHLEKKLALNKIKDKNNMIPIIIEQWSKNEAKKKKVKILHWKHEVIAESDLASLVEINVNSFQIFNVKLVLATKCYAPVLGDNHFRYRIKTLFGVPILDDPTKSIKTPQKLKPQLLSALQIKDDEVDLIPTHIHLESVYLKLNKINSIISVPPPDSFVWTCKQLGLNHSKLRL